MKVAVFQNNPRLGEIEGNLDSVAAAVKPADFDLLVLPELFATGYYFHSHDQVQALSETIPGGKTTQFLLALAKQKSASICAGLPEKTGRGEIYNSALIVSPDGLYSVYRKLHLFYEEQLWFTPGDREPEVQTMSEVRLGMMICFDWRFPEVARILALKGAQVILHPANLIHPHCQGAMVTRCLENGVYAVTANRTGSDTKPDGSRLVFTGNSQIVDPKGTILAQAPPDDTALLVAEIDPETADNKLVTDRNDLISDRRPEHYGTLIKA